MNQRSQRRRARRRKKILTRHSRSECASSDQPARDALDVTLDAAKLSRDEDLGRFAKAEIGRQERGRVDVRIAVNLAEAQEFSVLQAGDQAKDFPLFGKFEVVLKTHQVEAGRSQVLGAQLNDCKRPLAWARSARC